MSNGECPMSNQITRAGSWPEPRNVQTTNKSNDSNLRISVRSVFNRRLRSVLFYSSHSSDSWFVPSLSGLKIFAACEVKHGEKHENLGAKSSSIDYADFHR